VRERVRGAGLGMTAPPLSRRWFAFSSAASNFNMALVVGAIAVGGANSWISGKKRVARTDMPRYRPCKRHGRPRGGGDCRVECTAETSTTLGCIDMAPGRRLIGAVLQRQLIALPKLQG